MVELEADDALASAAAMADRDPQVTRVIICTPDKDLAQCVVGTRVVQLDRRRETISDEERVVAKFGVLPRSIPDWLALVGDSADGFPGIAGWGKRSASVALSHYLSLEAIPQDPDDWDPGVRQGIHGAPKLAAALAADRERAALFKDLATLRVDASLLSDIAALRWVGPAEGFAAVCEELRDQTLERRVSALATAR